MIVKLKPLRWFQRCAFEDHEGDFWATAELRDKYNNQDTKVLNTNNIPICITQGVAGTMFYHVPSKDYRYVAWAVATVITKREYPEYFI